MVRAGGGSYPDAIHLFRQWMYPLGREYGWTGFADPDAQRGGLWREVVGDSARPPHREVELSPSSPSASGSVRLGAGGAEYIEITGPADLEGLVEVRVEGPDGRTKVSAIGRVGDFPQLCDTGIYGIMGPTAVSLEDADDMSSTAVGLEDPDEMSATTDVRVGGGDCSNAVVVITNTGSMPNPTVTGLPRATEEYTWSLTFKHLGAQLSNGTLDLGVHRNGVLGYQYVAVERQEQYRLRLDEGWGISDGSVHGGVNGGYYSQPSGDLAVETFSFDDDTAESTTASGELDVTHRFKPSGHPGLYAVDVTVERSSDAPAGTASGPVIYRRTMEWRAGNTRTSLTWSRADGGDDGRVLALTDRMSRPDPAYAASGDPVGYDELVGPYYYSEQTIDLDLGPIPVGSPVTFTLFIGITLDAAEASTAVAAVDADVYSLVRTGATTGVFGYRAESVQQPTDAAQQMFQQEDALRRPGGEEDT